MAYWSSRALIQPTELATYSGVTGVTLTVGGGAQDDLSYAGAAIDGLVASSADIDSPTWANLISLSGGPLLVQVDAGLYIATSEHDASESLRGQVLIDGTVVWDAKVVAPDATDRYVQWWPMLSGATESLPIYCESTFVVRVARKDGFDQAESKITLGNIRYEYIKLL